MALVWEVEEQSGNTTAPSKRFNNESFPEIISLLLTIQVHQWWLEQLNINTDDDSDEN